MKESSEKELKGKMRNSIKRTAAISTLHATLFALTALLAALALPVVAGASAAGFDIPIGAAGEEPSGHLEPSGEGGPGAEEPGSDSAMQKVAAETPDAAFTYPSDFELSDDMIIAEGIYAGSINLGKMTVAQAKEAINDFYDNVVNSSFSFEASADTMYKTTLANIGFSFNVEGVVEEAAFLGKAGLLTDRYMAIQDLKYDKVVIPISYSMDESKLTAYITNTIAVNDTPSQNGAITRKNGEFIITPSVTGVATDIEATVQNVLDAIKSNVQIGMKVLVVSKADQPTITGEALQNVKDLLGSFWTDYSHSADGRKNNVAVASGNINGTLLMPGEQFSASDTMKERTAENGYQKAGEYVDGATVEAIGGGVCQVATTLYNAALRAELQIDKRYNHSMLVSYVEPSFDAAISWGNKDLKFTNNTEYPIYIEAIYDGNGLCFNIYGKETRAANRKIEFENVIISRVTSETQIKEDPTQPIGYEKKDGSNHDACKSYLVKKIYIDGVLTDEVKFATDSYMASYEVKTIGTLGAAETPTTAPVEATTESGQNPVN